ncbi:MAG: RNA polymerase sigma factor, partial [Gemmatimonadota bacterium]
MVAIREGDEEALGRLMDRYRVSLLQYAQVRLGRRDEAEDVAQDVFVRLWETRMRWKTGGSVPGYLYRIAANLVVDRARQERVRRETRSQRRRLRRPPPTPMDEAVNTELREAFDEALAVLPSRRREAFLLVRFEGLTLKEAGEAMGLAPRTVANHIYLAVTDLERSL